MRWTKTLPISSFLLHTKSFSSSSTSLTSILLSKLKTHIPSVDPLISQKPIIPNELPHSDNLKAGNLQIPISQNHQDSTSLSQSDVVSVCLSLKNHPLSALKYFNWVEKQRGFSGGDEYFYFLFQILLSSNCKNGEKLVRELVSSQHCPDATLVIQGLMESAARFEFCITDRAFKSLLNAFVSADRIDDAIVCSNFMLDHFGKCLGTSFANFLLLALIKMNRFNEVEELLNNMFTKGMTGDVKIIWKLMRSCLTRRKFDEAEQLFRKSKDIGFQLGEKTYSRAVEAVSKKPDSNAACELLKEMKEKNWVPSSSTFNYVIKACVQQKNMVEALRVKNEMISCGRPMYMVVLTSLMKGYCELGDMESASSLFANIIKDGHSPIRLAFLVLIRGYCKKGNVEEALKLYNLCIKMGIQSSLYITFLLIKGFLDARAWERAFEQLITAVDSGVIKRAAYNFLMAWLCAEGKVDKARRLWEKIVETKSIPSVVSYKYFGKYKESNVGFSDDMVGKGFKPNAITYTILMEGYFKKGEVEKALKVFDEMVNQGTFCIAYTYNTIIRGLCYNGQTSQARKMLEKFTEGGNFTPSFTTYNFIIDGYIVENDIDSASSVYTEMAKMGISRDTLVKRNSVDNLCKINEHGHALKMISMMVDKGCHMDVSAYEALIYGFCKRRKMKSALVLFSKVLYAGLPPSQYILNCISKSFRL